MNMKADVFDIGGFVCAPYDSPRVKVVEMKVKKAILFISGGYPTETDEENEY